MDLLRMLEALFSFIFAITIITQVIIPLWRNLPLFPLFNPARKDLEIGLKTVHDLEEQQRLADELRERTQNLLNPKQEK